MTRSERHTQAAALLSAGKTSREAAQQLGISYSYLRDVVTDPTGENVKRRRIAQGGRCIDCGNPTSWKVGGASERCAPCRRIYEREEPRRWWTRERIIDAIQDYADRYGHPPSARDWNPAMARRTFRDDIADRFYEDGCWPASSQVQHVFGRWNDAIQAAGFTPLNPGQKYVDHEPHAA